MCRETWCALGFGRPMRTDSEDCDVPIPSAEDVLGHGLDHLSEDMQAFLPPNLRDSVNFWINLLELSLILERLLKRYYRPRSAHPLPSQIREEEMAIWSSRERLENLRGANSSHSGLVTSYLKIYYR